jgi:guanylate kinase
MPDNPFPLLLVFSAPSGAGKSSLCNRLAELNPGMIYSVSCTTRAPRGEEQNGVHYHFLTDDEFCRRIAAGEFIEHARVHGNRYGTLRQTVTDALENGHDIIMDIDVQGAEQIRSACASLPENHIIRKSFVDIFIAPPSMDELRRRLSGRGTDAPDMIEKRLRNAEEEMRYQSAYKHVVINDDFEKTVGELNQIVCNERKKRM